MVRWLSISACLVLLYMDETVTGIPQLPNARYENIQTGPIRYKSVLQHAVRTLRNHL
jgi:hypothetical protein